MREVHASDGHYVAWIGSHIPDSHQCVQYTMPGVRFGVRVTGTHTVKAHMRMGGNFFTVRCIRIDVPSQEQCVITSSSYSDQWVALAVHLDPLGVYEVSVTKRTEPVLRSVFSSFGTVHVSRISVSKGGHFLPVNQQSMMCRSSGWIEIIGDSDACGFGVSGPISSTSSVLSMDPEKENVELAWGSLVAEQLGGLGVVTTAYSGKGIAQNAPMCGSETLPQLWADNHWMATSAPQAVVVLAGGNDFYSGSGPSDFVETFSEFLTAIKLVRGEQVPVFVFQCSVNCASSIGSPDVHGREDPANMHACNRLVELTRLAVSNTGGSFKKIIYHTIDVRLDIPADFAIMMHWSECGQAKIANEMTRVIRDQLARKNQISR